MLSGHDSVADCAVVGHYDNAGLLKPKAFVCLRNGVEPSDELFETARQAMRKKPLTPTSVPRWLEFNNDLPRTSTGKLQRFKLQRAITYG